MHQPDDEMKPKTVELTELVRTQLFKEVSMAQVGPMLKFCPILELARDDKLFVPGQSIDKVYVLLRGSLKVFSESSGDTPVAEIKPGECVGLASFVDRQPCHVTVISAGYSRLLPIDERRLLTLVNTPTVFSRNLLFMLMKYMREKAAREAAAATAAPEPTSLPDNQNLVDAVTGLHNQRWLDETLDRLTLRSATDSKPLSLVAVDLLQPAALTAEYGQEMVDAVLREIAGMLRDLVRPTDLLARHNNGRIILMLPDTDLDSACVAIARIEEAVNTSKIVIPGGCDLPAVRIVMGCIMMKAFVASRKLVADAMLAMEQNREIQLANLKALAAAKAEEPAADSVFPMDSVESEPDRMTPDLAETTAADELAVAECTASLDEPMPATDYCPLPDADSGEIIATISDSMAPSAATFAENGASGMPAPELPSQAA